MQVSVAHMLQAYQKVLPRHGIIAAEDTYYYRMLITLSLRPEADWWDKMQAERGLWQSAKGLIQLQPGSREVASLTALCGSQRPSRDASPTQGRR